jgi:hypothetical protein
METGLMQIFIKNNILLLFQGNNEWCCFVQATLALDVGGHRRHVGHDGCAYSCQHGPAGSFYLSKYLTCQTNFIFISGKIKLFILNASKTVFLT